MSRARFWTMWPALAALLVPACGGSDAVDAFLDEVEPLDVRQQEVVREAARSSDPVWILALSAMPANYMLDVAREMHGCPALADRSDAATDIADWRVTGGCSDAATGARFEGSIAVRGNPEGTEIQYRDFRMIAPSESFDSPCRGYEVSYAFTGVVRLPFPMVPEPDHPDESSALAEPDRHGHYDVHVLYVTEGVEETYDGACQATRSEVAYDVTMDVTLDGRDDRFAVEGRVATRTSTRSAPDEPWRPAWPLGSWRVSARDYGEGHDPEAACYSFVTGTLSIAAGDDVATLAPNATDSCVDEDRAMCAPWSVNGEPQPDKICGFRQGGCSAGPDASPPWLALAIVLTGLLWQGRRRRSRAA